MRGAEEQRGNGDRGEASMKNGFDMLVTKPEMASRA